MRARSNLVPVQRDQFGQFADNLVQITGILGHDNDAVRGRVLADDLPVPVINLAAFGRDKTDIDPVFFGQQAVLVGLIDLHEPHPRRQPADKGGLKPAQHQGASRQALIGKTQRFWLAWFHARTPTVLASAAEMLAPHTQNASG